MYLVERFHSIFSIISSGLIPYSGKFSEGYIFGKVCSKVLGKNIRRFNFRKVGFFQLKLFAAFLQIVAAAAHALGEIVPPLE